jgi:FKBP-type peptidyl-prolyl cis-trans isomerase
VRNPILAVCLLNLGSCSILCPEPDPPEPWFTASGLIITDLLLPEGVGVVEGQAVSVHYTANLASGVEVDSSYSRGAPLDFNAGMGQVPSGVDEGVLGMIRGGQRLVIAPPSMAFTEAGIPGKVPAHSTITFNLELMEVGPPLGQEPE